MLFWKVSLVLATASFALATSSNVRSNADQNLNTLDALELAANSRIPNIPLPKKISNSTRSVLQLMTAMGEFEVASLSATLNNVAKNTTGFTDFKIWTRPDVVQILNVNLAENELVLNYTIQLLKLYQVDLIPEGCSYKAPLSGISIDRDVLLLQEVNTMYIDALQDASKTIGESGDSALLPILWSIATSKAEQNGFYRLFADSEIPSERAFMTSIPPALVWSAFSQALRKCPFDLGEVLPIAAPLFNNWIVVDESVTYCANLSRVPSDISQLSLSIMVGDQLPVTGPARNVELNGTIIFFDADYPAKEGLFAGMVFATLNDAPQKSTVDVVGSRTLASSFIQREQTLQGNVPAPEDKICPRVGGTLFWDFISP